MTERTKKLIESANRLYEAYQEFDALKVGIRSDFLEDYKEYTKVEHFDYGTKFLYEGRVYNSIEYYPECETPQEFASRFPEAIRDEAENIANFYMLDSQFTSLFGEDIQSEELVPECAFTYLSVASNK